MNFDGLSDDQLLELIRAACAEAMRRSPAVKAAAERAARAGAEKGRTGRPRAHRQPDSARGGGTERVPPPKNNTTPSDADSILEAEKKAKEQAQVKKKVLAQLVVAVLGSGWSLNVWNRDGEKRVHLVGPLQEKVTYYVTGNDLQPPKKLVCLGVSAFVTPYLQKIVEKAAKEWKAGKIDCDQAAAAQVGTVEAVPADFLRIGEMRRQKEAVEALERKEADLSAEIAHLLAKAESAARKICSAEAKILQREGTGIYKTDPAARNHDEALVDSYRAEMSEAAHKADELRSQVERARAVAATARAAFEKNYPGVGKDTQ